jgi:hypothetical protein
MGSHLLLKTASKPQTRITNMDKRDVTASQRSQDARLQLIGRHGESH